MELMNTIPDKSLDMILCDLPYGTTACKWDTVISFELLWEQYNRIIKDNGVIALFGSEPFSTNLKYSNLKFYKYDWIWEKNNTTGSQHAKNMPLRDHELISIFSKGAIGHKGKIKNRMKYNPQGLIACNKINRRSTTSKEWGTYRRSQKESVRVYWKNYPRMILRFKKDKEKIHPTQKPVKLCEYLIKTYTDEGDLVLDNCMGSGSTGVACVNTNRNFIGMELNNTYFEIAKKKNQ